MFTEKKPKDDKEWLELRTRVLTATEIGIILGLNKWESVASLLDKKKNPKPFENAYTWMGQVLEPVVAQAVNKELGTDFKLLDADGHRHFFIDEEMGLGATPDADDGERLLECKSTKPANHLRWSEWPPAYYIAQLYTQLYCTGREEGYLAIMSTNLAQYSEVLNLPLHIFLLKRSAKLDKILEFEVARFWEAEKAGKLYRVNRKQAPLVELMLRFSLTKIKKKSILQEEALLKDIEEIDGLMSLAKLISNKEVGD